MTALPFDDDSVDVIVGSLAIHNIPMHDGRRRALGEAMRVLLPGGRLAVADLGARQHAAHLRERGWRKVQRRSVAGGPWMSTQLATVTKPG